MGNNFKGVLDYLDGRIAAYEAATADLKAIKAESDLGKKLEAYDRALCSIRALKPAATTKLKRGRRPKAIIVDSTSSPKKGWKRTEVTVTAAPAPELKHRSIQGKTRTSGFARSTEGIPLSAVKEALVGLLAISGENGVVPKAIYDVMISDPRVTSEDLTTKAHGLTRLQIKLSNAKRDLAEKGVVRDLGNARTGMVGKGNRWALANK